MKYLSHYERKQLMKQQEIMGAIAIVCAVAGYIFPTAWLVLALLGIILGGEARVSNSHTAKVLGIIAEVIISIEIVILYVYVFNVIA